MQSPSLTPNTAGANGKNVKGNVVVPVASCDGQLDAAEGGASTFALNSALQGERLGMRSLRINNSVASEADILYPDVSTKSGMDDVSTAYGKQQSRLTAQLAVRQRRPSNLSQHLELDGEEPGGEEIGPWGLLKKDHHSHSWKHRFKWRLQRLSRRLLVKPGSPRLQKWFYMCVLMAILSGWEVPFHFAFLEPGGLLKPYQDWVAIIEYVSTAVFIFDFVLKFNMVYIDTESGMLVASRRRIAWRYVRSWQFFMDLVGWFPLDWIIIDSLAAMGASRDTLVWLAWIKMLTLVRMYRVFELFQDLDYRMVLSQGTLMLTRNYTYVVFTTHWAACVLYHIAAHQDFSPQSWVGRNAERLLGRPVYEKYLLSLYFSTSAFTGLGDAALFAATVPEAAFMVLYLLFNLFLGAYILGTVTMLVVKGDERSKAFRERMSNLNEFSRNNELPERLQSAMQEHLEVTFNTEQIDDEHVLCIYPTTIRRKVLRHLYMQPVRNCYLFRGCKQRFLDALLTASRVELFMPGVQLLIEGDNVTELNIIVSGDVLVAEAGINLSAAFSQFASTDPSNKSQRRASTGGSIHGALASVSGDGGGASTLKRTASLGRSASIGRNSSIGMNGSVNGSIKDFLIDGANGFMEMATGKKVMTRYSGDALADVPFFTDVPSNETIMTQSVVRLLSIPKAAWEELMDQFPQQARLVLTNLQVRTETALSEQLQEAAEQAQMTEDQLRTALQYGKGGKHKGLVREDGPPPVDLTEILSQATVDFLHRLDDVRAIVRAHVRKVDQLRTFEFLGCASDGDTEALRTMLNQGMNPNSADYDGRTALMLAASGGHEAVVRLLLDSGAKSDQLDAFGNSAMCEAVKNAHDNVIDVLLSYGATLAMEAMAVASVMCTAVFEGDLVKLRRLLRSGAPPDACDYDKRSALHIAGAEGNLAAVKLLIEEGGADPNFQDRWGNTALDEARRVGATPVVAYLEGLLGADKLVGSGVRYRQQVATDFLSACSTGDVARVRYITHNSHPGCIFTGLVLAATKGFKDVAELLLSWVPSDLLSCEGHMALVAAARMGHSAVVASLRAAGLHLSDPRDGVLVGQLRAAVLSGDVRAVAALLAAGIDVRAADGSGLLHAAASTGSLELVRRLVEEGCMRPNAEDSAGKTPAAVAEAAKLTAIADYLRWATTAASSMYGSGSPSVKMSSAGNGATSTALTTLAVAAEARFGALPDYTNKEYHDEISHGVLAPDALSATDDDNEPPPLLLAKMGSFNSVGSSRRPTALGSFNRQPSMARGNALWRLSSMARVAVSNADEPDSPELNRESVTGGGARSRAVSRPVSRPVSGGTGGGGGNGTGRRVRRASLTNFLTTHRHPDLEMDFAAFLAGPSFSGPSVASATSQSVMHKRRGSSSGAVPPVGSTAAGASAATTMSGGGGGRGTASSNRRRSSATGGAPSGLTSELAGLSAEVAGLAEPVPLVAARSAASVSLPAGAPHDSSLPRPSGRSFSAAVGRPGSPQAGALPPQGPGAVAKIAGSESGGAGAAAAGPGFVPSTPSAGSPEAGCSGTNAIIRQGSAAPSGQRVAAVIDVQDDSLETFLQVAQSARSASKKSPLPPPPVLAMEAMTTATATAMATATATPGIDTNTSEMSGFLEPLRPGRSKGTASGALAEGEWSHRTLEKRLTALSPPMS